MQSFIDLFINELLNRKSDLSADCVVFPTRRACLIFKKKFSDTVSTPVWLPAVYSIDDLISTLSPYKVADAMQLNMELFIAYKKSFPQTPFEKFIAWGEMLLKDFNEADLQMVNVSQLFSDVYSLHELDMAVGLSEEENERIKSFWKLFSDKDTGLKKTFLENWRMLPGLYESFNDQLRKKGLAYNGMAMRTVATAVTGGKIKLPWNKIYFAGFYALSNAEKDIFNHLVNEGRAEIFRDADHYYVDDRKQEAGKYFRKNQVPLKDVKWTFDHFKNEERNIVITGIPLNIGQAKYAGVLLKNQNGGIASYDHTAVVIPDEKLLMPVLYALPSNAGPVNVTMGYPLKGSTVELLVRQLKSWRGQNQPFPAYELIALLENNLVAKLEEKAIGSWLSAAKKNNRLWLESVPSELDKNKALHAILFQRKKNENPAAWLADVFLQLLLHYRDRQKSISTFDFSLLKYFYEEVDMLNRLTVSYSHDIEFNEEITWKLIFEMLKSLKIPLTGEPVNGLQVMGFLETRNLDFENLYILSVNEEIMPGTSAGNSYIPYVIRKAYGLPTYEDQDAIYAYHFYRLLQRAKNIHLLYNTVAGSLSGGEKSRYLLQLAYELKKSAGDKVKIRHELVGTGLKAVDIKDIVIKKDGELAKKLESLFTENDGKKLSATALTSFIGCSLQFYFKYIAGIRVPDEIKDAIDPAVFGSIIHDVMERFYKDKDVITSDYLQSLIPTAEQAVEDSIRLHFPLKPGKLTGKNSLLYSIMTGLIKKVLAADIAQTPFTIEGLEKEYKLGLQINNQTVSLYGKIDRIESKDGFTRIIDYKTGKDKAAKKLDVASLFSKSKDKASFQLLLYSLFYKKENPSKKIKSGLFSLRTINQGIDFINEGEEISVDMINEFEWGLKALVEEILNPESDFRQTTDLKICAFCDYRDICNR
jgi:CRISPR/Cas system-associated exonuclease Cas4 (RecB family)